jgi:hypothetical protein
MNDIEKINRGVPVQARRGYAANQPQESQKTNHRWILGALMILAPAVVCAFTDDAAAARIENALGTPRNSRNSVIWLLWPNAGLPLDSRAGIGLSRFLRRG